MPASMSRSSTSSLPEISLGTQLNWGHTKRCLLKFFGADRAIDSITNGEARDFERWLATAAALSSRSAASESDQGLAPNTIRKRISNSKQFFEDAVQCELLTRNPFAGLKGAVGSNRLRDFFVTREMASKVLEACPDAQWRLLFALSRYAGLRCPSETLALQWDDINWADNRMTVRSSKTEHHEGKGVRVVPLFPELRPYLDQAWEEAEPNTQFVITRYREKNANLRTQLQRIIAKAGLETWPKLFGNLRASRATELATDHPAHVAAAWLGHSTLIANKHYWQVTESDFEQAKGDNYVAEDTMSDAANAKAAQNAAQSVRARGSLALQEKKAYGKKPLVLQGNAPPSDVVHKCSSGKQILSVAQDQKPGSSPVTALASTPKGLACPNKPAGKQILSVAQDQKPGSSPVTALASTPKGLACPNKSVGDTGLEPVTPSLSKPFLREGKIGVSLGVYATISQYTYYCKPFLLIAFFLGSSRYSRTIAERNPVAYRFGNRRMHCACVEDVVLRFPRVR